MSSRSLSDETAASPSLETFSVALNLPWLSSLAWKRQPAPLITWPLFSGAIDHV
jgi:hypothetical protein